MIAQEDWLQQLVNILKSDASVMAFYEAGSGAFQAKDEYSDYDLYIVAADQEVTRVAKLVEDYLSNQGLVDLKYQVPNPWHGYYQVFFHLKGQADYKLIDLLVLHASDAKRLSEVERHGQFQVFFDKADYTQQTHVDPEVLAKEIDAAKSRIDVTAKLFHSFVDKELHRGRAIDAMSFYMNILLPRYVQVLRIKHCPHRHDFGSRYLYSDLPDGLAKEVEQYFFIRDADDLLTKKNEIYTKIRELLR